MPSTKGGTMPIPEQDEDRTVRARPLVWFYSTKLYDPSDYDPDDPAANEHLWQAQAADGDPMCGGDWPTFEDALIGARLLAVREQAGWTMRGVGVVGPSSRALVCWCGWIESIDGCYIDPLVPHVKAAHPEHWTVKG